jgi:hypothetical protein
LANATIKYYDKKRSIDEEEEIYLKYYLDEEQKDIEWDRGEENEDDFDLYDIDPLSEVGFSKLPDFISEAKNLNAIEKEFSNYLYHEKKLTLYRYSDLKLESDVGESLQDFNIRALSELRDLKEQEIDKLQKKFDKKRESFEKKHQRALEKLQKEEDDVSHKTTSTLLTLGMAALDFFSGRGGVKRSTLTKVGSSLRGGSRIYKEKGDVERAKDKVADIEEDFYELEEEMKQDIENLSQSFELSNFEVEEFYIKARRADIYDLEMALLWSS